MKYLGGKQRLGKHLAPSLHELWNDADANGDPYDGYLEPFCGSLGVFRQMTDLPTNNFQANDYHPDLIQMWKEVKAGTFVPPDSVSEDEYLAAKMLTSPSAMKSFVGFGMSFGGRFFGAYSQKYLGNKKEDFCKEMRNSLGRAAPVIQQVKFTNHDYRDLKPRNMLIYCDPPYRVTKFPIKYRRETKVYDTFDNDEFWDVVRKWSVDNTVIVSETTAPDDFMVVWEKEMSRSASNSKNTKIKEPALTEKMFMMK